MMLTESKAVVAPDGIGVRDGFLSLLLSPVLAAPVTLVFSILLRFWMAGAEGLTLLVLTVARGGRKPAPR